MPETDQFSRFSTTCVLDDSFEMNVDSLTAMTTTGSLALRRPDALSLAPLDTTVQQQQQQQHQHRETLLSVDSGVDVNDGPSKVARRTLKTIDIGFTDLSYTVKVWRYDKLRRETKTIIDGLCGEFRSGELTAIMGPSGAGKSTLMDILAGYTTKDVLGHVTINNRERILKTFHRQSAYIMQNDELQPFITVMEAMHFSTNLKIGSEMSPTDKKKRIRQILEAIGLWDSRKTRTGNLSGGQKKRLSLALEIVDNPPVMLFDEPTSGLDSSTSTQVVALLKKLAQEGRTIICTIHQPSAIVMGMFDHVYAVADGKCIFSGATNQLLPFLAALDLVCPESYNPTDYLLEIATHDYGVQNDRLIAKTRNGAEMRYRKTEPQPSTAQAYSMHHSEQLIAAGLITPVNAPALPTPNFSHHPLTPLPEDDPANPSLATGVFHLSAKHTKDSKTTQQYSAIPTNATAIPKKTQSPSLPKLDTADSNLCSNDYATSFWRQLSLLMRRTFLNMWRDRSLTTMRLFIHICIALLIGTMYFNIGNDAKNMFNIFRYIFFSIMFLMFTAFSAMTMAFPLELPIVTREHFNRWYSLRAYYAALTLADLPIQTGCILVYVLITYFMTAQPLEIFRLALFFGILLTTAFVAQSLGLVVGALFNVKNGAIFGPFFICPFLIFSGFFIHLADAHEILHWLFHISFLKYALEGATLAIFGYDRSKMDCSRLFCEFVWPKKFMKTIDMQNGDYVTAVVALSIIFLLFRCTAFGVMYMRLVARR